MKQIPTTDLYNLFVRIHNKYMLIKKHFCDTSTAVTVYPAELQVLTLLSTEREETVSSISEQLSITRSAASQLVKKLCAKGLLTKNRQVDNERVVSLRITETGAQVVTHFFGSQSDFGQELAKTVSGFSPKELAVVVSFFQKLEEQFNRKLGNEGAVS